MIKCCEKKQCNRLSEFYDGKSIFITGAAGFIGSILLEIFLRCLPEIKNIFILIRPKKGIRPEERKNIIFKKNLFKKLLKENPNAPEKVTVVAGDVIQPNLGMSDADLFKVTKEVTIIFHVASTISFLKPLRYIATHNCIGLKNVIELSRKLTNLEVLIYTSTAYSNANRHPEGREMIFRLPWTGEKFIKALEENNGDFERMVAECKPDWPNNYTFTKCLAENIIVDMASDLPIAIMRPSVVAPVWKSPLRGYIEEGSSFLDLPLAVGKGIVKVAQGDLNIRFDVVPADIVANAHIVAAWAVATERLPATVVINCTSGPWNISFKSYAATITGFFIKHQLPKGFLKPHVTIVATSFMYRILAFFHHYLPAYAFDLFFFLKGSKFRLVKIYKFMDIVKVPITFFCETEFYFKYENFNTLSEQMDPRDTEIFSLDRENIDFEEMVREFPKANSFYDWSVAGKKSPEKRKIEIYKRSLIVYFIQSAALMLLSYTMYRFMYLFYTIVV